MCSICAPLADLVRGCADEALEEVSHYATEPAAKRLEKNHPGLAARLWRAQAMRIFDGKKSKYYDAALSNLKRARDCYQRAGLATEWEHTVRRVCALHHRKTGFIGGFHALAAGAKLSEQPSFLEREDAMGRTSWERCSLRTAKRSDPALPEESGKERTDETVMPITLANPVELIVLSVKQKAARCRLRESAYTITLRAGALWDVVPGDSGRPAKETMELRAQSLSSRRN